MNLPLFDDIIPSFSRTIPSHQIPLYTSMDIRTNGNRTIVVDTNVFPAGFNNIHPLDYRRASDAFKNTLSSFPPNASVLLICEENTRNPFYLTHLNTLCSILVDAGYTVRCATFLANNLDYCQFETSVTLADSNQSPITLWCLHHVIQEMQSGLYAPQLAILNNDLSNGLAPILSNLSIPILPSTHHGWYQRQKSHHFDLFHQVVHELASMYSFDPTLFLCHHDVCHHLNINDEADRLKLSQAIHQFICKSGSHSVFIKHNSGTYGMGIMVVQSGDEMINLNRKGRNRLQTGKNSQPIHDYFLQEGIPTTLLSQDQHPAEWVVVNVGDQMVGLFMRVNQEKGAIDNLNSSGMLFEPVSLDSISKELYNRLRLASLIGIKAVALECCE